MYEISQGYPIPVLHPVILHAHHVHLSILYLQLLGSWILEMQCKSFTKDGILERNPKVIVGKRTRHTSGRALANWNSPAWMAPQSCSIDSHSPKTSKMLLSHAWRAAIPNSQKTRTIFISTKNLSIWRI